jgi:hypothetical protein
MALLAWDRVYTGRAGGDTLGGLEATVSGERTGDDDLPERLRWRADFGWRMHKRGRFTRGGRRYRVVDCACARAANGEWLPDPTCARCHGFGFTTREETREEQ